MGHHRLLSAFAGALGGVGIGCFGQFGDYTQTGSGGSGAGTSVGGSGVGGGSMTTTGAGGSGGAATCDVGTEDCTNDCDDDRDGLIDCADAECSAFVCVAAPTTGWIGPAMVAVAGSVSSCPAGTVPVQGDGTVITVDGAASCDCSAVAATGGTCTAASLTHYSSAGCASGAVALATNAQTCTNHTAFTYTSVLATSVPAGSTCPGPPTMTISMAPITETWLVCAAPSAGGGCQPNEICAPRPSVGFEPRACVHQLDGGSCPPPYDALALVVGGGGVDDQRTCGSCGYNPTGGTCNGRVELFFNDFCTGPNIGEGPTLNSACLSPGAPPNQAKSSIVIPDGSNPITPATCVAPLNTLAPVGKLGVVDPRSVCCTGAL